MSLLHFHRSNREILSAIRSIAPNSGRLMNASNTTAILSSPVFAYIPLPFSTPPPLHFRPNLRSGFNDLHTIKRYSGAVSPDPSGALRALHTAARYTASAKIHKTCRVRHRWIAKQIRIRARSQRQEAPPLPESKLDLKCITCFV